MFATIQPKKATTLAGGRFFIAPLVKSGNNVGNDDIENAIETDCANMGILF